MIGFSNALIFVSLTGVTFSAVAGPCDLYFQENNFSGNPHRFGTETIRDIKNILTHDKGYTLHESELDANVSGVLYIGARNESKEIVPYESQHQVHTPMGETNAHHFFRKLFEPRSPEAKVFYNQGQVETRFYSSYTGQSQSLSIKLPRRDSNDSIVLDQIIKNQIAQIPACNLLHERPSDCSTGENIVRILKPLSLHSSSSPHKDCTVPVGTFVRMTPAFNHRKPAWQDEGNVTVFFNELVAGQSPPGCNLMSSSAVVANLDEATLGCRVDGAVLKY